MTESTSALSEVGGSPSPFEDVGEPDISSPSVRRSSTTALHFSSPSLSFDHNGGSKLRIHRIQAHKRLSAPEILSPRSSAGDFGLDSMPSVPMRRGSHASVLSIHSGTHQLEEEEQDLPEDDTMREDEDDDLPTRSPLVRQPSDSEKRFADDKDGAIAMPVRQDSAHARSVASETSRDESASEVVSDSQNRSSTASSSVVTEEAIENLILSQIPEHIRNQMTPEMWRQIFTVNAISKHPGAASVCSELTDDVASRGGKADQQLSPTPINKRRSIDHTGMVEEVGSPSNKDEFVKECDSHSTFRTFSKDAHTPAATITVQSSSLTKEEEASTASPETSPLVKRRSMSPRSVKEIARNRTKRPGRRRSEDWKVNGADAPPSVPVKKGSLRSSRGVDRAINNPAAEDEATTASSSSGRRIPKRRQYSVRFCPEADVRNYERILEVHPSTSSGPSVGIGWKFVEDSVKVSWCPSHNKKDLLLSRQDRERIVRVELGYSPKQIAKAVRENLKIKNQRRRTVNNLQEYGFAPVEKVEYLMEKCQRKLGRLMGRKSSKHLSTTSKELSSSSKTKESAASRVKESGRISNRE